MYYSVNNFPRLTKKIIGVYANRPDDHETKHQK